MRRWSRLLALAAAAACSNDTPTAATPGPAWHFPSSDASWATVRPVEAGFDSTALAAALDWAGEQNSSAVVVAWRGRIVAERYWNGWTSQTRGPYFSAGKTITAALTLDLVSDGALALSDAVSTHLGAGWSRAGTAEDSITVRHLLAMASGTDDSLRRIVAPSANRFYYNNPAYYQMFGVAAAAGSATFPQLVQQRILTPIGMSRTLLIANEDTGEPGFVFVGSARDFARFGILTLNHGRWNGAQLVADSALLARARQPSGTDNLSYGWLWWLNGGASHRTPGSYLLPTNAGPMFPAAPVDLAAALGLDDKKLYVVPSLDLVVVRLGDRAPISGAVSPAAVSSFDNAFWTRLMLARPGTGAGLR
ncbi:serine hydrolase [Pseudogemmatithrix spongiicola]|uniref:Serine hydrolase n=1 Tax=Pseudogemmatithrix spongiicola TaxID=3062599 RepID=A0AA49JW97_9BACT|nr:serine hydrolase [Gemmatimonadaceae bacterium 'strain 138']WKW16093.1 serine hydrolase [Gemmatimonadaceae bacterium 'strain 318']